MRYLVCLFLLLFGATAHAATPEDSFQQLMQEGQLGFSPPADFHEAPPGVTPYLDYEKAMRSNDGKLELRLSIRPLQRLTIDYDDPHGATPNPNHIFPLVFESLTSKLSGGSHAPSNEYTGEEAKAKFGADWAALSAFDLESSYPSAFKQGLLLAIHRSRMADAYMLLLYDDYPGQRERIKKVLETLRFRPAAGDISAIQE